MPESKTPVHVLEQCKSDYITGNLIDVYELAERHGINKNSLHSRIIRENWKDLRAKYVKECQSKLEETREKITEKYLRNTFERAKRYERIIDKALDQACDLVDPEQLNQLSLVESRTHDLAKSALRIPDVKSLDVTSKGQSLGESFASALAKLRETDKTPELSDREIDRIVEAEIVDDSKLE